MRGLHTQRPGKAVEHDRHLLTGDGIAGAETAVTVAGDDAKGRRPADSLPIVGVGSHIGKERRLLRLGLSGRPPQEGHQLAAGAVRVRREMRVVRSEGDPLAYGPEDRFIVIIVRRHVREGDRHVGCVQKGRLDRHFGIRHDKGISALAKRGEGKGLAQRIRHDKRFQYIALVRRDGEGHGFAGAHAALADRHFPVRCLHGAERMAGRRLRRISVRIFRGDRRGGLILVRDLIVCGLFTGKGQGPVRQDGGDIVAGEDVAQNRAPCSVVPPPADGDGTGNDLPDAPFHTGVVIGKFRLRGDPYACSQVDGPGRKRVCFRCRRPWDLISLAVPEQPLDLILLYDLIQAGQMLRQKIPAGCDGDISGKRVA